MKTNETKRVIILSLLLITGFVINAGYVASGQADTELDGDVNAETLIGWNENGISFMMSGEYEKAIECFDKAIELNPNHAKAYHNREVVTSKLEEKNFTSGFEAIFTIIGLLAAVFLFIRWKSS